MDGGDGSGTPGRPPGLPYRYATARRPRRSHRILITLAVTVAVVIVFLIFTAYWTELLWFRSVG